MKKTFGIGLGLVLAASMALASNTGFKLNYPLTFTPGFSNTNWVSFPYFFYPNQNVGTPQVSQDLCIDLNGGPTINTEVTSVVRWNTSSDTALTKFCANTLTGFPLVPGAAYSLVPAKTGVTAAIVGSHDDTYSANKSGSATVSLVFAPGFSNNNWMSVPYHTTATNAQDLCVGANVVPGSVSAVVKWNAASDTATTKFCVNTIGSFAADPGLGVSFVPTRAGVTLQFNVY